MPCIVTVSAPSRLHFGLWSLGGAGRQYGGVGAMVERPGLQLSIRPAETFLAAGPLWARVHPFATRWAEFHRMDVPACRVEIESAPAEHAGLGTGTQLGLAIAAGLSALVGLPSQSAQELALSVGRGLRSAVGSYGFVQGGLIVEQGKLPGEPISPLDCRLDLPAPWRFVLVRPLVLAGLAGDEEASAIDSLPAIPGDATLRMIDLVRDHLVPAAATGQFDPFAESLRRYGELSGQCFAARQGGTYNGPILTRWVRRIQELGAVGVGQSSWGPTLFVVQPNEAAAQALAQKLQAEPTSNSEELEIVVTPPANRGATITVQEER
ncbi:MAG: hypothetical protein WD872_10910 [Pirellulaceae bacterium]